MTRLFSILFLFTSFTAFSQTNAEILNDKFRPLVFQLEKSLSSSLKERLSHPYPSEISSIQVKLSTNPSIILKRLGISNEKPKFALPGLDDSNEITNDKIIQFNPTLSDVVTVVTKMDVFIFGPQDLSLTQRSDIQKIIESEVSSLGIKNVSLSFKTLVLNKEKDISRTQNVATDKKPTSDYSLPIVIVASGLLVALVISIFLHQGMRRIETNIKELNNGLANLATNSGGSRNEPMTSNNKQIIQNNGSNTSSSEDPFEKLQKTIQLNSNKLDEYFKFIIDIQDPAKMLVLIEAMSNSERQNWQAKIPTGFKKDYDQFINYLQTNTNTDEILSNAAREIIRDFKLIPHDENYLVKKAIKHKISLLKKDDIYKVIENSNELEFAYLLEMIEPITLASTLALHPNLLNNYSKISSAKLDPAQLAKLSDKLNVFTSKLRTVNHVDISFFLSPEVEAEFNKKSGKSQSLWESFSEPELLELERFARSLSVSELSSFVAILPEKLKGHVLGKLPDIKAQQIQRLGIKLTEQSFKLKHEFLARSSKGAVQ